MTEPTRLKKGNRTDKEDFISPGTTSAIGGMARGVYRMFKGRNPEDQEEGGQMAMAPTSWNPPGPAPPEDLVYANKHEQQTMLNKGNREEPGAYVPAQVFNPEDMTRTLIQQRFWGGGGEEIPSYMPAGPGGAANGGGTSPGGGSMGGGGSSSGGGGNYSGGGSSSGGQYRNYTSANANQQRQGALGTTKAQVNAGVMGQRINSPASTPSSRASGGNAPTNYVVTPKQPGWMEMQHPNRIRQAQGIPMPETLPGERPVSLQQFRSYVRNNSEPNRGWGFGQNRHYGGNRGSGAYRDPFR